MAKSSTFPFSPDDFLLGVKQMTMIQRGQYITLLCHQWQYGHGIEKSMIQDLIGMPWHEFPPILRHKFQDFGEFVANPRLLSVYTHRMAFLQKQRENGGLGGRPKGKAVEPTPERKVKAKAKPAPIKKKIEPPTLEVFMDYAKISCEKLGYDFQSNQKAIHAKYLAWSSANWHTGQEPPRVIRNWKSTLLNTIGHLCGKTQKAGKISKIEIARELHRQAS